MQSAVLSSDLSRIIWTLKDGMKWMRSCIVMYIFGTWWVTVWAPTFWILVRSKRSSVRQPATLRRSIWNRGIITNCSFNAMLENNGLRTRSTEMLYFDTSKTYPKATYTCIMLEELPCSFPTAPKMKNFRRYSSLLRGTKDLVCCKEILPNAVWKSRWKEDDGQRISEQSSRRRKKYY